MTVIDNGLSPTACQGTRDIGGFLFKFILLNFCIYHTVNISKSQDKYDFYLFLRA